MTKRIEEYVKPANVEEYVMSAVHGFVGDPPDTDSQWGYLSALLVVAKEALGQRMDMPPFAEAHQLWKTNSSATRGMRVTQRDDNAASPFWVQAECKRWVGPDSEYALKMV